MSYIGKEPIVGNFQKCDAITTSSTATYNLTVSSVAVFPETTNNCIVSLNGVIQAPTSAYTISGSQIIFNSSLTSSDVVDFILILGSVLSVGTPTDNTVSTAKVADDAITLAKMASGTDGQIITYDASGNPTAVGPGSDGQVLTSTGAGSPPAFEAIPGGGKIGQVIHTGLTSVTSTTSSTASAISGLTATITPSATSSKVLILVYLTGGSTGDQHATFQLFRDTTQIALGDAASSRSRATFGYRGEQHFNNYSAFPWHVSWVDSPSSTSALTYSVKWFISSGTLYLNRSLDNTDNANYHRTVSHITAMEVLA